MDAKTITQLLASVGTKKIVPGQTWVRSFCPMPWRHSGGVDKHPSFGVAVSNSGLSHYVCSCGSGSMMDLVYQLRDHVDVRTANKLAVGELTGDLVLNVDDWGELKGVKVITYSEIWWESFPKATSVPIAMEYLATRPVSPAMADALDIRWDGNKYCVCFPIRDRGGRLVGVRGRHIQPSPDGPRYHAYKTGSGQYNSIQWLGEDRYDPDLPVVFVESVFDYASVYRVYKNVLAPLSTGITRDMLKPLVGVCDVVTFFDNGKGGDLARKRVREFMADAFVVDVYPYESDPGDMDWTEVADVLRPHVKLSIDKLII